MAIFRGGLGLHLVGFFDIQFYVLKNLNETRWSCRADVTKTVVFGFYGCSHRVYSIYAVCSQDFFISTNTEYFLGFFCPPPLAAYIFNKFDENITDYLK